MEYEINKARETAEELYMNVPIGVLRYITCLEEEMKQLTLTDVVNCVYVVTERDNYGDQTFKGVFKNKEQALKFLAKDGLTESNIDEINEI